VTTAFQLRCWWNSQQLRSVCRADGPTSINSRNSYRLLFFSIYLYKTGGYNHPSASWNKFPLPLTIHPPSLIFSLPSLLLPLPLHSPSPLPFLFPFLSPFLSLPFSQIHLDGLGIWCILSENLVSGENNFSEVHEELHWLPHVYGKTLSHKIFLEHLLQRLTTVDAPGYNSIQVVIIIIIIFV